MPPGSDFVKRARDYPLLSKLPESVPYMKSLGKDTYVSLNDEEGIEFETDLFKGRIAFWVKGVTSTPDGLFEVCLKLVVYVVFLWIV